jgi:hypothetical protein
MWQQVPLARPRRHRAFVADRVVIDPRPTEVSASSQRRRGLPEPNGPFRPVAGALDHV